MASMSQYSVDPEQSHMFSRDPNRREAICRHCKQGALATIHQLPFKKKPATDHAALHRALDAVLDSARAK